jgi:hypothetical protein
MTLVKDNLHEIFHIPELKPKPDLVQPDRAVSVVSYPPLGQVTRVTTEDVSFFAVLDAHESLGSKPWEVSLWYSTSPAGSETWLEHSLSPSGPGQLLSTLQSVDGSTRIHFSGTISVGSSLRFTLKFRPGPDHEWRWIRDERGVDDGIIINTANAQQKESQGDLPHLIRDLNPDLKWKPLMSQSPRTSLWTLEAAVEAASEDCSAIADIPLGIPWGNYLR